ncbi:putative PAS domain containing protein envoy [Trichoderma cornu-damae]|uniref:PAS domain containing protein envoy n=1 Tax=Trichoderma cornu-damae TaxID=654480 RepID=A0A9P8TUS1_9HYPO|nr:putative PAS domain containing protein envoy [Trichoderma cornu-damae]
MGQMVRIATSNALVPLRPPLGGRGMFQSLEPESCGCGPKATDAANAGRLPNPPPSGQSPTVVGRSRARFPLSIAIDPHDGGQSLPHLRSEIAALSRFPGPPIMVPSGSSGVPSQLNTWEDHALEFPARAAAHAASDNISVPNIYPGIYSASGIDVMGILQRQGFKPSSNCPVTMKLRIVSRPNPCIDLGPLDCSVSLTLCDLSQPNAPIIYASPGFYELTGYSPREIMGRNCRFLQNPPHVQQPAASSRHSESPDPVVEMRRAIRANQEIRVEVPNYKKNGSRFTNLVTILPLWPDSTGHHYAVGLQVEL